MSCHWIPVSCHLIPVNCHQNFQIGSKSSQGIGWWERQKDVPRFVSYHFKYFNEGDGRFLSLWKGGRGCLNKDLKGGRGCLNKDLQDFQDKSFLSGVYPII